MIEPTRQATIIITPPKPRYDRLLGSNIPPIEAATSTTKLNMKPRVKIILPPYKK